MSEQEILYDRLLVMAFMFWLRDEIEDQWGAFEYPEFRMDLLNRFMTFRQKCEESTREPTAR